MCIEDIREQYEAYCIRMKEKGAKIQIIPFKEFKKAMKKFEEKKNWGESMNLLKKEEELRNYYLNIGCSKIY